VDKRRSLALGTLTRHTSSYREVEQEQKPRDRSFIRELIPDWRAAREQVLWTVRMVIVLVLLLGILTLIGLPFKISLWDWMKLLIVPAVIAAGGLWFNRQQRERELEIAREQRERELTIADRRAQEEALQVYLDQIGNLLLDKDEPLRQSEEGNEGPPVARARTLTVLRRLDGNLRASILQFLHESGLISKNRVVVDLRGANLRKVILYQADLSGVKLSNTLLNRAYLYQADLSKANLNKVKLNGAYLGGPT
jgi:hypothetical protein